MLALPHIDAEVARLQADIASAANITVQSLLIEAEQARTVAKEDGNGSAMVAATTLKARLCGLLIDRVEDIVQRVKLAADRARIGEVRKAGQWLADAAKSLDLPERATPAQIVGALAERPLITPKAFLLLREARMAENAR